MATIQPIAMIKARRRWNNVFKELRGKNLNCQIRIPIKSQKKGKVKAFKQSLKGFLLTDPL